jgi:hypothetical protein
LATARKLWLTLGGTVLFILNFFICHELFRTEYTDRVISGDASFISISRYMLDHWRDSSWWPVWYDGIPGHNAYPPLLHAIVAELAAIERISPALAHHQFATVVYALAPVGLFFLCYRMSGSAGTALAAGLGFSLISPSTVLISSARLGAGGWFGPWRLCVLAAYGDAPHMFGLALIPFAILALDSALKRKRALLYFIAALLLAAVVLTNWLGSVALACTVLVYLIATTNAWADLRRWGVTAVISVCGYLLACPWIPPSTLLLVRANGQLADGDYRAEMQQFPLRALAILAVLAIAKFVFHKWRTPRGIQFAALLVILPGGIPLLWAWTGAALLPLPHRYEWELDFAVSLLAALLLAALFAKLPRPAMYSALALLILFGCFQLRAYRKYASALIQPVDMSTTIEYKVADWLKRNQPQARVFAIGTVSYWLNNFSDLQQVTGGFEHATPNPQNRDAIKAITFEGPAPALLWLRALGADIAVVGGPKTRAPFRTIADPAKFDTFARKIWNEGDDSIYLIPRRSRSLAHVVRRADLAVHAETDLQRYVSALEDASLPVAVFTWQNPHTALVSVGVPPGDVLSVQINYDPGWHATVNGSPRRIEPDGLGLMAIDPSCTGPCTLVLTYDGGLEALLTRWAAAAMLILFTCFSIAEFFLTPA